MEVRMIPRAIPSRIRPIRALVCLTSLPVVLCAIVRADDPMPARGTAHDCGFISLLSLLRLEGFPTSLQRLEHELPAPQPNGHSMKDLRDAAHARGLKLTGVSLTKDLRAVDRPMIIFLNRGKHGHFVVIRPVGHSGKLVQVIDSNREPEVLDKTDLVARRDWTGLALIPDRPDWPFRILGALTAGSVLAPLALWRASRLKVRGGTDLS